MSSLEELPALKAAWEAVLAGYAEPARHETFLELARSLGALDVAAACYRRRLDEQPGDPEATRRLGQIVVLATHGVLATRSRPASSERPYQKLVFVLVALGLVLVLSLALVPVLLRRLRGVPARPGPPSPAELRLLHPDRPPPGRR